MPNARLIKRRIRSAQNISKITKAMEMVSASKMRKAQQRVLSSRPYSEKLTSSLAELSRFTDPSLHPLLQEHPSGNPVLIVFSTDRGLCGGLNTNLFKIVTQHLQENSSTKIITIGKKAREFGMRAGWNLVASFSDLPEQPNFSDVLPLTELLLSGFLGDEFNLVNLVHNKFITTLKQEPEISQLLPLNSIQLPVDNQLSNTSEVHYKKEFIFEPDPKTILDALLPAYVESQVFQTLLDARASEHSARMIAMQNASNNAGEVVDALQLEYNKSRQAAITTELIEITTASLALSN